MAPVEASANNGYKVVATLVCAVVILKAVPTVNPVPDTQVGIEPFEDKNVFTVPTVSLLSKLVAEAYRISPTAYVWNPVPP
jgi:hypothetical protein